MALVKLTISAEKSSGEFKEAFFSEVQRKMEGAALKGDLGEVFAATPPAITGSGLAMPAMHSTTVFGEPGNSEVSFSGFQGKTPLFRARDQSRNKTDFNSPTVVQAQPANNHPVNTHW